MTKHRGTYSTPKKIQVTSGFLQKPVNGQSPRNRNIELKLKPLVASTLVIKNTAPALLQRSEGYALNRTQSTGGIATKVSLELKKKYLLGESISGGSIQKSGSASTLDSKFKSFRSTITDCQKLLKPAPEISASMQTFCKKLDERLSPVLSPSTPNQNPSLNCPEIIDLTLSPEQDRQPDITRCTMQKTVECVLAQPDLHLEDEGPCSNVGNTSSEADKGFAAAEHFSFNEDSLKKGVEIANRRHINLNNHEIFNMDVNLDHSPVHETTIIVPDIDWSAHKPDIDYNDSLSSEESDSMEKDCLEKSYFENIPRLEIHDVSGKLLKSENEDIAPDSLCIDPDNTKAEKKMLNQPKFLPDMEEDNILHNRHADTCAMEADKKVSPDNEVKSLKTSSGCSTPSNNDSGGEQLTTALTETELSDWARDADDFEDVEIDLSVESRRNKKPKNVKPSKSAPKIAKIAELDDSTHICGKEKQMKEMKNKILLHEAFNILENIEFMDTGTETSSDEGLPDPNNGYMQFRDEDDIAEDSLSPRINGVVEAVNLRLKENTNTGYCIIVNEENNFGATCEELKASDLEKLKQKNAHFENDDDSLLIIEAGTTTEENTCSDSTVKNVTAKNYEKYEEKKSPSEKVMEKHETEQDKVKEAEYEEHCQRLQSKVEFGNVKDSIDIRKSRRKSKSESPPKPDLIEEEKERSSPVHVKNITLQLTPSVRTPENLYKKEEIEKERDLNQKLVQEMVMNKMKSQNKTLERKKRNRNIFSPNISPNRPFELTKSVTADLTGRVMSPAVYDMTPDVILPAKNVASPVQKSSIVSRVPDWNVSDEKGYVKENYISRPLSVYCTYIEKQSKNTETFSLPDINKFVSESPKPPPRTKNEESKRNAEKMKQSARAKARLLSNEELGLSPEEKLKKLREKIAKPEVNIDLHVQDSIESLVLNTERRNSILYFNDTLSKKKNDSFKRSKSREDTANTVEQKLEVLEAKCVAKPLRTKSVSELTKNLSEVKLADPVDEKLQFHMSDPNLLTEQKRPKKKSSKDPEHRKSISKILSTLFMPRKKDVSPNSRSSSRGFLSRISSKPKDKSKVC